MRLLLLLGLVPAAVPHSSSSSCPWLWLRGGADQPPMYENNGGTVMALAGDDFVVIAADTRLSKSYSILSRDCSRLWELSPGVWLGMGGCLADMRALAENMQGLCEDYRFEQGRFPGVEAVAQALSATLYGRRQMPYYAFCVLAGLDRSTRSGAVFTYDAVGNYERVRAACVGGSQSIALPILDQLLPEDTKRAEGRSSSSSFSSFPSSSSSSSSSSSASASPPRPGSDFFQRWSDGGESPTAARPPRTCGLSFPDALDGLKKAASAASRRDIRLGDTLEIGTVRLLLEEGTDDTTEGDAVDDEEDATEGAVAAAAAATADEAATDDEAGKNDDAAAASASAAGSPLPPPPRPGASVVKKRMRQRLVSKREPPFFLKLD
jgi:20S proteasome alpha/beta subunit